MAIANSHTIQAQRRYEARSSERFDRIAYAMTLLRLLKPPMTVAVYPGSHFMHVERSRPRAPSAPWATLGIPAHATRETIASAIAELAGRDRASFLVDLLCTATPVAAD